MSSLNQSANLSACFAPGLRISMLKNASLSPDVLSKEEVEQRAYDRLQKCTDPVEKIRYACLAKSMPTLKALGRNLRRKHTTNRKPAFLNKGELAAELKKLGLGEVADAAEAAFGKLDANKLELTTLLEQIRPPLNPMRSAIIGRAFDAVDSAGSGEVSLAALKAAYCYKNHPQYSVGAKSREDILHHFFDKCFNASAHSDNGLVTREDFFNYYAAVSMGVESDIHFDHILRSSWPI